MIRKSLGDIEVNGKTYSISKKGTSIAFELKSVWTRLLMQSGLKLDSEITPQDYMLGMMAGMHGEVVRDFKRVMLEIIDAPEITEKSYELIDPSDLMTIFDFAYNFYFSKADDKKKEPEKSSTEAAQVTNLEI